MRGPSKSATPRSSSILKSAGIAAIGLGALLMVMERSNPARAQSGSFRAVASAGQQEVFRHVVQVRSRFPNSQSPAGCNETALKLIVNQNPTGFVVNGSTETYTLTMSNTSTNWPTTTACDADSINITFLCPNALGTPGGTPITVASNFSSPSETTQTFTSIGCPINVNVGILTATARVDFSGTVHTSPGFDDSVSGSKTITVAILAPTDTPTPTSTSTQTPTSTPTSTSTPTPTVTQTSTDTATPTATPSLTPTSTFTNTPTNTPTSVATNTSTATPTSTQTSTPSLTPTNTPTSTSTPTPTPTFTQTSTPPLTPTNTPTSTSTPTPTPTFTQTSTPPLTPTNTPTSTATPTATLTFTQTNTPLQTPTNTPTSTATNTVTQTPTGSLTVTPTPTTPTKDVPSLSPVMLVLLGLALTGAGLLSSRRG